ncbi:MAG: hypothetical protein FWH07_03105 [Oscillospiraceae bacterium]|nr:hypothetical protein [Oscillospiraceae bacterium]
MKKRILSLVIAFAMVVSIIPVATITVVADSPSYDVKLMTRIITDPWDMNAYPAQSNTVTIDGNTAPGEKHTVKIENINRTELGSLSLRPAGASFCGTCEGVGGLSEEDVPFACPGTDDADCGLVHGTLRAPGGNAGIFGDVIIRYTKVMINDTINALPRPVNVPLLSGYRVEAGHADAHLWNGWYNPARRLRGVERIDRNGEVSFRLPGGATIQTIEAEFEVYLYDNMLPEPQHGQEQNGVAVFLGAREALDWRTDPDFWKSPSIRINKDGEYSLDINFLDSSSPAPVDRLSSLAIMSHGSTFETGVGFRLNAREAPQEWVDNEVLIEIKEVKINNTVFANTWGQDTEFEGNKDLFVSSGNPPTAGYINAELWNGWPAGAANRYLTTSEEGPLYSIRVPVTGNGNQHQTFPDADRDTRNFALGNANLMNSGTDPNPLITSISVTFIISGINEQYCDEDGHDEIVLPCHLCDTDLCQTGCGMPEDDCACLICSECLEPWPFHLDDCPTQIEDDVVKGVISTQGKEANAPTIFCVLEILKYIVGMDNLVEPTEGEINPAALLTADSKERGTPDIFDVLEILKYIVGMTDGSTW